MRKAIGGSGIAPGSESDPLAEPVTRRAGAGGAALSRTPCTGRPAGRRVVSAWRPVVWVFGLLLSGTVALAQVERDDEGDRPNEPAPTIVVQEPGEPVSAAPARGSIQDVLRQIDPKKLNLSGAELDLELVGDQLILRGNESDLDVIELLITLLEQSTEQKELRVVTVTEKDAKDIAATVEPALQAVFFEPNLRDELKLTVTALSSNILLVSALPKQMDFIVDVIEKVDATEEELPELERLVFPIKHRKAADAAEQLKEIIGKMKEKVGATGAKHEIQIIANDANNSIMVLAPESERAKIQTLLNEIDVEPAKGWGEVKLTLFPLLHSKANEMAQVVSDLLKSQKDREAAEEVIYRLQISKALPSGEIVELPPIDLQKPTRILADEGTNSLIVATVEENIVPMGELIRLMDGVPMAEEIGIKLFPLRFADAQSLAELLKSMVDEGTKLTEDPDGSGANAVPEGVWGKALVYNVGVFADVPTNTLIVTGRPEHLVLVAKIVGDLDRPSSALKFPLRFITLEHTSATRIADLITELFDKRISALEATETGRMKVERERIFLSADARTNSLIVSASDENFAEIAGIAQQLDSKPAGLFDQIRIIPLRRLRAADLQTKIDDLWQRKADLRRERDEDLRIDLPVIVVDERSNALIIAASIEDFDEIQRLVSELEAQPLTDETKLFKLEYADAEVLAGMLEQLFQGLGGDSESFRAPTILPDPRSNALVAAGSRDALEQVTNLVTRLDVKAGPLTAIFKVYPLEHASAAQLASRMQELFDSRAATTDISRTPIVILADESSNSLVCSASRDDHASIADLLRLLDKPSSLAKQFEIFPLKMAKAATVAEELDALFQSRGEGASGRADAIATEADERTNSIIVWASPSQMANVGEVIARLDTSTPIVEMRVKVVQLKQALAEDFAQLLQRTITGEEGGGEEQAMIMSYIDKQENGEELVRRFLRQDIRIEADPRTNSLMIVAPADSVAMLEAMIRDFDTIRPIRSELRLFPLINSDAQAMADQLSELFSLEGGGDGETRSRLVFGDTIGEADVASVGQELRFAADTRTNTLVAAGAEVDLRMVEDLVKYLDSQSAERRVTDVYVANYLPASDIASAVQGFNQQEQDVLGELTDEESSTRRMERQISVEAVGTAEEGSSSLIVGTSPRMYEQIMNMIHELDRPEPQVRISVVIAEVSLTDSVEFGIEVAGQELDFTRSAVMGPNGVIQGSDFDFVAGTNLGAAGTGLGFNFTITGEDFSFLLHALEQTSRLEVLSRPTLVVRNGQEGNITIADQIPIVTSSQLNDTGSTNSVVGSEDVGIVLTATPNISPDGYVTIALTQEISNFSGENLQLTEGVSSPVLSTREVDTNVTIRDGETVVIGGLITTRRSEGVNKVPILGDLPLIGPLFRSTSVSEQKTELLIVMTVDVLRTDTDTRRMSIQERDNFVLPDSITHSPLMESLRIRADEKTLGPVPESTEPQPEPRRDERELYGPRPKAYGPLIPRPKPITTTTTTAATDAAAVYGPRIVRNVSSANTP